MEDVAGDSPRETAAFLVAMDELTAEQIAQQVGVSRSSIQRWKNDPQFSTVVESHRADIRAAIRARGIAVMENRLQAQHDRWSRMRRLLDARAADLAMANVPGGDTGLLVRRYKTIGAGDAAEKVEEFEFDAGLMREMRELETQAANELGQRSLTVNSHTTIDDPARAELMRKLASNPDAALALSDVLYGLSAR